MFNPEGVTKTQVRLPNELHERIKEFVRKQEITSMNGGIVKLLELGLSNSENPLQYELLSALENILLKATPSIRLTEVSERLNIALRNTQELRMQKNLAISHIAQELGYSTVRPIEEWFRGLKEPTFDELKSIAKYFGVNSEWLLHNEGSIYQNGHTRLSENPALAVIWLTDKNQDLKPNRIYLVRCENEAGNFVIVKQYDDWHAKTYRTTIHISEMIGAGGEAALTYLFAALELLYKIGSKAKVDISSYLVEEDDFHAITGGRIHPLVILQDKHSVSWWEDIWDKDMDGKPEYWKGFNALSARIIKAINYSSSLVSQLDSIRSGSLPFLDSFK